MSQEQQEYDVELGGHRGEGCTDHDKYQWRDIKNLPVENTVKSIKGAFLKGASYVEIDACGSAQKAGEKSEIYVIHNTVPEDHFFGAEKPPERLNKMAWSEIRKYKTGRNENGDVALLGEILQTVHEHSPRTLPWSINIELKHLAGSKQAFADEGYIERVAEIVENSPLKQSEILYSSFSFDLIKRMSLVSPQSHYGQLFRERKDGDETTQPPAIGIYTDLQDDWRFQYLPFSENSVELVKSAWTTEANGQSKLGYMHPESQTINKNMIDLMAKNGMGLNGWDYMGEPTEELMSHYKNIITLANHKNVAITVITDYLPEMRAALNLK